ncbi:MAG: LiaF-related protein, partial [Actinobacteria bacterium]|nr:LiaF-related protein [Actinomycetota bacterium]
LLDSGGVLSVSLVTGLALALLVTGGALVVGAWRGRARWLIPLGLFLGVALMGASVIDVPIGGGVGERLYRPASLAEVSSPYRLGAGELTLDLRDLDLSGSTTTVVASVGVGEILVIVPYGPSVDVDAELGVGELHLLGRHWEGLGVDRRVVDRGVEGGGRLILRIEAGAAEVEVRRASA